MHDFISWITMINESSGLLSIDPKPGDLIFFGIHLLSKYNKENGTLPTLSLGPSEDGINISSTSYPITDVDPITRSVFVEPQRSPFSMGYRNKSLNERDRMNRIKVPVERLQDVSHLLQNQSQKVWLLFTNNKYQDNLIIKLRKYEMQSQNQPQEVAPVIQPQMPTSDQEKIDQMRAFLANNSGAPQQAAVPSFGAMFQSNNPTVANPHPLRGFIQRRKLFGGPNESVETKKAWKYY